MNRKLYSQIERTAWISPCERYRHALGRHWDRALGCVVFIGLNPSTADAMRDDPTIRRCINFAYDWGYGGIEMCNLFDWRSTDPKKIPRASFTVSNKNDWVIYRKVRRAKMVIACWGRVPWADLRICDLFSRVYRRCEDTGDPGCERWKCLGHTKDDYPKHPLYLRKDTKPTLFW